MELKVIQKLRELSDKELAEILIKLMVNQPAVYTAFVDSEFLPEIVNFDFQDFSGNLHQLSISRVHLDQLIAAAPTFGENKVGFIKTIRSVTGMGLPHAKFFSEGPIHDYVQVGWKRGEYDRPS